MHVQSVNVHACLKHSVFTHRTAMLSMKHLVLITMLTCILEAFSVHSQCLDEVFSPHSKKLRA